jgi:myosin heavy chain 6/7
MKFTIGQTMNMFKNVAGIMHMGEMKFKQRQREEQAEVDTEDGEHNLIRIILYTYYKHDDLL